jgi:hypothetical protein
MSGESVTNPYESLGLLHNDGLDYIINNLGASPTVEEVLDLAATYMCITCDGIASPSIWQKTKYTPAGANALNAYLCNDIDKKPSDINAVLSFIYSKISSTILNANSRTDVRGDLEILEAELIKSSYSYEILQPALIAIALGKHSADYWNYQIDNIGSSPWGNYLTTNYPDLDVGGRSIIDADVVTLMITYAVVIQLPGGGTDIAICTSLISAVVVSAISAIMAWVKGFYS